MRRMLFALLLCAFGMSAAHAAMQAKPVEWKVGKDTFSGYLVYDDANAIKRPGLVMVPELVGRHRLGDRQGQAHRRRRLRGAGRRRVRQGRAPEEPTKTRRRR